MNSPNNDTALTYIIDFFKGLLKYWYIVIFSLAVTVGSAVFYLKYSAKTYTISASVALTIERSNAFGANSEDLMRVNELIEQEKNLQNEIQFFQSTPLIKDVVENMEMQVSYFLQEDKIPKELEFSMKNLYKDSPFIVVPSKDHLQPINTYFYVRILDEETCLISVYDKDATIVNFADEKVEIPSTPFTLNGTFKFGEEISNPFTSFRILLNSRYNKELYLGKDLFFTFNTNESLTKKFKSSLSIQSLAIDATVVNISLTSDHIRKGIDFLDGLIAQYIDKNLEEKNFLANKTIEHLDFQLADISESLGSSEQELQDIRRTSSVMNIDEKAGNLYNQLQTAMNQKDEMEMSRSYLRSMQEYFTSDRDSTGFMAPSAMGLQDPMLSSLIEQYTSLVAERQQIINNNQLRNPRLRTLEISINNMKEAILENVQYSMNSLDVQLREINSRIRELNREFSQLPYTQRRLLGIERRFNLSENVYMSLLEQRIQAQIIKASTLPDCEVIEPPQYISVQSPKTMIILIGALFIGLLIPSIFVLGKKMFSSKIMNNEELRKYTGLSLIGTIPSASKGVINVITEQPNSITAEAFHSLRSNIIYYLMGKSNQTILVTSTMEGEGKSFSALNIASSLAVTNNKTLLLEFDLRRPSDLYSKLGIRGLIGVSSYLINKASLDEIIISSDVANLDIILAGQIPPNPIELLSSKKTTELFSELQKRYDYIIIDTPPYGVLTDSFLLMKYADIKIYVTRLGYVNRRLLLSSFDDIESKGIDNIQLLLNGESPKQGSYGKYYTTHRNGFLGLSKKGRKKPDIKKTG
jgi:capsular exopolysaccharide synthesis family protein